MNASEIGLLLRYVRGQWPHYEINDGTPIAYERLLGDLDAEQVLATVDAYAVQGEKFAPSPGELRRLTIERNLPPVPDAGEAWGMFMKYHFGRGGSAVRIPDSVMPLLEQITDRFGGYQHIHETWMVDNEMADRAHFLRMWNSMVESEMRFASEIGWNSQGEIES